MKKYITLALAVIMLALTLAACDGGGEPPPVTPPPAEEPDTINDPSNGSGADDTPGGVDDDTTHSAYKGVSGGISARISDDGFFNGCNVVFITFDGLWKGSFTHTEADFTNIIVYVNDIPSPVSITEFTKFDDQRVGLYFVPGGSSASLEDIELAGFAQYPATYQVSLNIQGVEITTDDINGIKVNADKSYEVLHPSVMPPANIPSIPGTTDTPTTPDTAPPDTPASLPDSAAQITLVNNSGGAFNCIEIWMPFGTYAGWEQGAGGHMTFENGSSTVLDFVGNSNPHNQIVGGWEAKGYEHYELILPPDIPVGATITLLPDYGYTID